MTYAGKLAARVMDVLQRQVKDKGYEACALLLKKEGDYERLGISDDGSGSSFVFSRDIKIIVTSHDIEQFPMELGDNPDDILDFIWIAPENEAVIKAGMILSFQGSDYTVTSASPTCLGGSLIIEECRAKRVR